MNLVRTHNAVRRAALLLPVLVLLICYGVLAYFTGRPWPWFEVVHESGDRTLLQTIFYFEHAARELPVDLFLGLAIGASALWVLPGTQTKAFRNLWLLVAGCLATCLVIVLGTVNAGGLSLLSDSLLQMHTRPGQPLQFGSHWRYHFLSRLLLMLGALGLAGFWAWFFHGGVTPEKTTGQRLFGSILLFFFLVSVVFGLSLEPFTNSVFLGHQAREVVTHALVTVPLAWWFCVFLSMGQKRASLKAQTAALSSWFALAACASVIIAVYLFAGVIMTSSVSRGQTDSLVLLVFPHFFEHAFSFVLVALVAGTVFEAGSFVNQKR